MKRRSKAKEQVNYSAEFFDALKLLEQEKGIPADHLLEKIRAAIVIAVKRDHGGTDENISVILDPDTGKTVELPAGIAHYLEHKLFENEECDAFERYAKTGANANAYTSFDHTAYLFSCTQNLTESLEILLDLYLVRI